MSAAQAWLGPVNSSLATRLWNTGRLGSNLVVPGLFGNSFAAAALRGSENNDTFYMKEDSV
jgi:hypothetical protein